MHDNATEVTQDGHTSTQYDHEDQGKIDALLNLRKEVVEGNLFHFERWHPKIKKEVDNRLTEEFGTIYKYKGGEPIHFVTNMLHEWRIKQATELSNSMAQAKENADRILFAYQEALTSNFSTHKVRLVDDLDRRVQTCQDSSDIYRYERRKIWRDELQHSYRAYDDESNLVYTPAKNELQEMWKRHRLFYTQKTKGYAEALRNFCEQTKQHVKDEVAGLDDKEEIKKQIHAIEDSMREYEREFSHQSESECRSHAARLQDNCGKREDRFQQALKELRESLDKAFHLIEKQHYSAAQQKHASRNTSRGKG